MWILDHLADVESDMSAFHRVDDIHAMPAPRFFSLANRLVAYRGVLNLHLRAEMAKEEAGQFPVGGGAQTVPDKAARGHAGFRGDASNPPVFGPRR